MGVGPSRPWAESRKAAAATGFLFRNAGNPVTRTCRVSATRGTTVDLPVIMAVDDDLTSLAILDRELHSRYEHAYRVVTKQSAKAALEDLERRHEAGQPIALVLADQWMPEMGGDDLLGRVRFIDPLARRVMLVNWGDSSSPETIYHSCAYGLIEFFMNKPWHSGTDERFHHEISDQLYQWSRANQPVFEAVKIVAERWSARAHELRDVLKRNGVPYGFYPVDSSEGEEVLADNGLDRAVSLPVAVVFGGKVLEDPTNRELAEAIGVRSQPEGDGCDLVVVGAGPAGLAAAVYAASEGLFTTVLERDAIGGQAGQSSLIANYLGFPGGISGDELAARAYQQAWGFGTRFLFANEARDIRLEGDGHVVELADGSELCAQTVVVASGIHYRRLGIPKLDELAGAGVYYGAVSTEARTLEGADVFVVGGGNSAGQAALHMAKYAHSVTLVVRKEGLEDTMSRYLTTRLEGAANVTLVPHSEIVDGEGYGRLEQLTIENLTTGERRTVPAAGLFVMIGAQPHTEWLPETILRDEDGFVLTGSDLLEAGLAEGGRPLFTATRAPYPLETSMPGVFAVGDVRHGSVKRVAAAVGEGAVAVRFCHQYLADLRMREAA
jgi:thioredoxin reductase (NADPH)